MLVPMTLHRIIISEILEQQTIDLVEKDGDRKLRIFIGIFEATSIERRVRKAPRPRPLTHDLLVNMVQSLGGELDSILIDSLENRTYFAKIRVRIGGSTVDVDARPSDAIAVAVTCQPTLPIWVEESLIEDSLDEEEDTEGSDDD
ncbi:MAG: bifunctional nuclease family protein [Pirellulaceae bacterium]|nr:bifunctional nuclease family protein [Planctomycetales bacterium]